MASDLARRAADRWPPAAQYPSGYFHAVGLGAGQDAAAVATLYWAAAEAGHRPAQARFCLALLKGSSVPADMIGGEPRLRRAALAGDGEAAALLGVFHARASYNSEPSLLEAVSCYRIAVKAGHAVAQAAFGMLQLAGVGVAQESNEALRLFAVTAAQGDRQAEADAVNQALAGAQPAEQVPDCIAAALRAARERDDSVAAFNLSVRRLQGVAATTDTDHSLRWLERTAEKVVNAQYGIRRLLSGEASGVADLPRAREWCRCASELIFVDATVALAGILGNGRGGAAEPEQSLGLYWSAAEARHLGARFGAGALLAGGHGLPAVPAAAAYWVCAAAQAGHPQAQLMLGRHLRRQEAEAALAEGKDWLMRAADGGTSVTAGELAAEVP